MSRDPVERLWVCDMCGQKGSTAVFHTTVEGKSAPWGFFQNGGDSPDFDVCCTCKKLTKVMKDIETVYQRSFWIFTDN